MDQSATGLAGRLGGRDGLAYGAALLFAFSMYASVVNLVPALDVARPALITSVVAAVALFGRRLFKREPVGLDGWRGVAMAAVCALSFASMQWSVFPQATLEHSIELLKDFAIYVTLAYVVSNAKRMKTILVICLLGGLAPAWGSYKNYVNAFQLVDGTRARWEGIYMDPNHMAMAMVFLVPIALALLMRGGVFGKILAVVSLLGSCTAIIVSGSRGGALGLALAVVIMAAREQNRVRSFAAIGAFLALFLIFSPKSFWSRTQTVADYQQDASAQGRVHAWEVGHAISLDRPLLGVGGGAFVYAWPLYAPPEARGEAYVAHNIFLAMIGELGWIGFMLFVLFVGSALAAGFRSSDAPEGGIWIRAVTAGAAGYLSCQMSSGYVTSAHLFFIFGLLSACERIRAFEVAQLQGATELVVEPEPVDGELGAVEGAIG
jgi:putative inorganic carbon (HCO3(-)) transporter